MFARWMAAAGNSKREKRDQWYANILLSFYYMSELQTKQKQESSKEHTQIHRLYLQTGQAVQSDAQVTAAYLLMH